MPSKHFEEEEESVEGRRLVVVVFAYEDGGGERVLKQNEMVACYFPSLLRPPP